jgi:hypothetical protein
LLCKPPMKMGQGLADRDFAAVKKVFERISDA